MEYAKKTATQLCRTTWWSGEFNVGELKQSMLSRGADLWPVSYSLVYAMSLPFTQLRLSIFICGVDYSAYGNSGWETKQTPPT